MTDSRYPYTHAADALRKISGRNDAGSPKLSRADASAIRQYIAAAIGMDDDRLAALIADKFLADADGVAFPAA